MEAQVLILTTTHDFVGKFELENVKLLQKMGCTVHYAANMREPSYLSDQERLKEQGVVLHHIEIARSPFLWKENREALLQVLRLIETCRIEMIHCHTPVGGVLGRLAGRLFRKWPVFVIYTAHGFHFYRGAPLMNQVVYYQVERCLAKYTDILITINSEDYRNACRFRLKKGGRVYWIPGPGLDRRRFRPLDEKTRNRFREKLGVKENETMFVSVGELNGNKNHRVALEALALLKEKKRLSGIRYFICGDGFFREELQEKIRRMGLEHVATMLGHCPNIPEILGCADASVFPSRREGLGMAGVESLAMGVLVLASDNRGTREYMVQGKNGFVYRYDDAEGFARGMEAVCRMDKRARQQMKRQSVQSARPFDRKYTRAVMERIYREGKEAYEQKGKNKRSHERVQSSQSGNSVPGGAVRRPAELSELGNDSL